MTRIWIIWLVLVLGSFFVLEALGYAKFGTPGTLSANVRQWSGYHPLIPFALGVAVGALAWHFWAASGYSLTRKDLLNDYLTHGGGR